MVPLTRSQTPATDTPLWNELGDESLVANLFLHLLDHIIVRVIVHSGVLQEQSKLSVKTSLNLLPVFGENTRLLHKVLPLLRRENMLLEPLYWRDPGWFADECGHMLDFWLYRRQDLDPGRSISDQANMLALKLDGVIPIGRMKQSTFVVVQTWYRGPTPIVEDSASIDQDVTAVVDLLAGGEVLSSNLIAAMLVVPGGSDHLMPRLHILVQSVLVGEAVEIVEDLSRSSVDG